MIEVKNPVVQPSLSFKNIFLKSFVLIQDPATGVKKVEAIAKLFATTPEGTRVFADGEHIVIVDDFDRWAVGVVAANLGGVQPALTSYGAAMVTSNSLNLLECMAAFQAGIGRIYEARGVFEVEAVS